MKKIINVLGIFMLAGLTACNAFKQKVNVGPGTEKVEDHTLEILLLLGVSFALGLWLGWILWSKFKQIADSLRIENENLTAAAATLRTDLDNIKLKLANAEKDLAYEKGNVSAISKDNEMLRFKLQNMEEEVAQLTARNIHLDTELSALVATSPESSKIPMEVVTSPIDLHVEDLAADLTDDAPTELNIEPETIAVANLLDEEPAETVVKVPELMEETTENSIVVQADEPVLNENQVESLPVVIDVVVEDLADSPEKSIEEVVEVNTEVDTEIDSTKVVEVPEVIAEKTADIEEITETVIISLPEPKDDVEMVVEMSDEEIPQVIENENVVESASEGVASDVVEDVPLMTFQDAAAPLIAPVAAIGSERRDDLKIVEGIGPKIEELLYKNGIHSFTQLAATPVSRLKEMLVSAGPSYAMHDPGTWPAQSLLAANGEWENLRAYQGFLNAGKRPK